MEMICACERSERLCACVSECVSVLMFVSHTNIERNILLLAFVYWIKN